MSKRSRKHKSRTKKRHLKEIRSQHEREHAREEKKYVPPKADPRTFWRRHVVVLVLFLFMAAGILGIYWMGPDRKAMEEAKQAAGSVLEMRASEFEERYPDGYKIIALVGRDIVPTDFDALPEELLVDWKNLFVNLVQTRSSDGGLVEKVEIEIPGIEYLPADVSGRSLKASFIRKVGALSVLTRFNNGQELVVEVVEDREDRFYCLFGIR